MSTFQIKMWVNGGAALFIPSGDPELISLWKMVQGGIVTPSASLRLWGLEKQRACEAARCSQAF